MPLDNLEIRQYQEPGLVNKARSYWYYTNPVDKFMDIVPSFIAGVGPAVKGLAAARLAPKIVPNALKTFLYEAGKGLAKEGIENEVINRLPEQYQDTAQGLANTEDLYRIMKLLR